MMPKTIMSVLLILLTGCSWVHARLTYDFVSLSGNSQILYEPGAEDLAKLVADNFQLSLDQVKRQQYVPFKDSGMIKVYVFNDRGRYARFSYASVSTRGSSTTNEVYLSERLREKIDTIPNILVHELSHVHIRQYTGTFKFVKDIPGWFLEGLAVSVSSGGGAEDVTEDQAQAAMRKAVRFEPDGSGRIIGHKTAHDYGLEPHMYYRQASMFVEYLKKTNPRAFEAALVDVLNGASFRDTWVKHYGRTVSELWLSYKKSIGE